MAGAGELTVRPARPDEQPALLALKCRIWPHLQLETERRRWAWEFDRNPAATPASPRALVLDAGGTIAGFFTLIPHRVLIAGEPELALDGVDFCVADEFRGRGASRLLVERWMSPETCAFAFTTTPSDVAIHVMTGCGGTLLGSVNETVAHAYFVDGAHEPHADRPAHAVEPVDAFGRDWDEFWSTRLAAHHRLLLVRDAAYLNWRYRDFPFERPALLVARDGRGALSGAAVVQRHAVHDRLYLCELLAEPYDEPALRGLLRHAVDLARASGQRILYHATRAPSRLPLLREAGFVPVPGEVPKFLGKLNRVPAGSGVQVGEWFVSLGDGDQLYDVGQP